MLIRWSVTGIITLLSVYVIIFTIADAYIMGTATPRSDIKVELETYKPADSVRTDMQTDFKCYASSSAFILKHWDVTSHVESIYEQIPHKLVANFPG